LPAGDRTYLVLAKPNVIMNVEGDGLGALNRLHGDQCADNWPDGGPAVDMSRTDDILAEDIVDYWQGDEDVCEPSCHRTEPREGPQDASRSTGAYRMTTFSRQLLPGADPVEPADRDAWAGAAATVVEEDELLKRVVSGIRP